MDGCSDNNAVAFAHFIDTVVHDIVIEYTVTVAAFGASAAADKILQVCGGKTQKEK